MKEIISVKINEIGEISLKTVILDEYYEIEPYYFDQKCCNIDEESIWYASYFLYNIPYVLQLGGKKHSVDCKISINPANILITGKCPCGFEHNINHIGIVYILKMDDSYQYIDCSNIDCDNIKKLIFN